MLSKIKRLRQLLGNLSQIPEIATLSARNADKIEQLAAAMPRTDGAALLPRGRSHEHEALLRNLSAIKANWPLTREPDVNMVVNDSLAVPAVENRRRVQGRAVDDHPETEKFIASGFHDMKAVINIAEVFGVKLDQSTITMDWGVGCSRMARHLPENLRQRLVGVDVDPVNIGWSREHMPFGRFDVLDPYGELPLESKSVDFIYSHSVLTHLREPDQDHWLQELSRVCSGLMVLSIHGLYSIARSDWGQQGPLFSRWLEEGFNTSPTPLPDIADVTDKEYYTGVAQTPDYVRSHWSEFVEVVEIIPGGFGTQHDAVVCRPKPH